MSVNMKNDENNPIEPKEMRQIIEVHFTWLKTLEESLNAIGWLVIVLIIVVLVF